MAKEAFQKPGFFVSEGDRAVADGSLYQRNFSSFKTQIGFIREVFPLRSKDDITLVLQSCDRSVEAAIACFANGEADNILRQWNIQGKKSKNGYSSKKKRNKKKQAKANQQVCHGVETMSQTSDDISETKLDSIKGPILDSEDATIKTSTVTGVECPSKLAGLSLLHVPSPSDSETSLPSPSSEKTLGHSPVVELQKKPLPVNISSPVKLERMPSGPDALKKTVKDLQRSSVSLARFQLLLEEECEKSFKVMTKTFEELRQCLLKRETQLYSEMEEFKKQAVELLEQRQENAAALKLKSERVGGMQEAEVILLRSEIKNFVTERKIDEELARTTRFVGDKEKLLAIIKNFGEVVPIKSCYSPVKLNPPSIPTKTVEKDPLKNKTSTDATAPNSATIPTDAAKTALKASVPVKSALSSHETIQEAAETHAKLQVALKKQGLAVSTGKQHEEQKQTKVDIKKDRPVSAPQKPSQRQILSQRQQTSIVPNEGQKPQPQNFRQDRPPRGQNRTQQNRQQARQQDRDSRRPNQRRPTQKEHGSELSNNKKEAEPKRPQLAQNPSETQKFVESKKVQQSQKSENDLERVTSERVRSDAPSEKLESGEKREGGKERGRNKRFRRRWDGGSSENNRATTEHNQSKENGLHEKHNNGPPSANRKGVSVSMESTETEIKESGNHSHVKRVAAKEGKDDGSDAVEKPSAENGLNTETSQKNIVNASNLTNSRSSAKESSLHTDALPQRPERSSHRRGSQWGRKDGPMRKPAANGVVDGDNKGLAKSGVKNTTDIPVVKEASAVENDVHLDKPNNPLVNGCIAAKEFKDDYSIDR